jgi:hypothetical protein
MIGDILIDHLRKIPDLYRRITPGHNLSSPEERPLYESDLLREIAEARERLRDEIATLHRPRTVIVKTGEPKGAWAHIYYISFHDPVNSTGPTEGFYPALLFSVDTAVCWLSVMLAAASVGISGRGGWSEKRGLELQRRATALGSSVHVKLGWIKGPIALGAGNTFLHQEKGNNRSAGRAYECGSVIAKKIDPNCSAAELNELLEQAFAYYDEIFNLESSYLEASLPHLTQRESVEQISAHITGARAEDYFKAWVVIHKPEWGELVDLTGNVGYGYDFAFSTSKIKVEVKGCRGDLQNIRFTEQEWSVAKSLSADYILAIVTHLDSESPKVLLVPDPYNRLSEGVLRIPRVQITYIVAKGILQRSRQE